MILSYEQIRQANICPDCARREVDIDTYPDLAEALVAMELCEQTAAQVAEELIEQYGGSPGSVNTVEVLHDPGCPRLSDLVEVPEGAHLIGIYPVDLPDDHPWVQGVQNEPR